MAGAIIAGATAVPIFWLIDTESPLLISIAVVVGWGIAACGMYGPEGALFAEVFPTRVRYSGMSAVYQIGVLPSGAIAPAVCTALVSAYTGASWPVAVYVLAMAVLTVVSLVFLPETHKQTIEELDRSTDAQPSS